MEMVNEADFGKVPGGRESTAAGIMRSNLERGQQFKLTAYLSVSTDSKNDRIQAAGFGATYACLKLDLTDLGLRYHDG